MMDGHIERTSKLRKAKSVAVRLLLITALVAVSFYLLLRIILSTTSCAELIASLLSGYIRQPVTISGLNLTGKTLTFEGISIRTAPDFKGRDLIAVRTLSLSPDLSGFLTGKTKLSGLEIVGLRLNLEKNPAGAWNFTPLVRNLLSRKKSGGEVFISHLTLRDTAVTINGTGSGNLDLSLDDFSTKGSTESRLNLSARDKSGNPFQLSAQGRLGPVPALALRVTASSISLSPFASLLRGPTAIDLDKSTANLSLRADLRNSVLTARGETVFNQVGLLLGKNEIPLSGRLDFSLRYDDRRDEARLEKVTFSVNDIIAIKGTGFVSRITKDGPFTLDIYHDGIRLGDVLALAPEEKRRGMQIEGFLTSRGIHLEGSRRTGITTGTCDFLIRGATLHSNGRLIVRDTTAEFALRGSKQGWNLNGRLFTAGGKGAPLIESLNAPFYARFTPRFRPDLVKFPAVRGVVMGAPLRGEFRFLSTSVKPYTIAFSTTGFPLSGVNRYLPDSHAVAISGGKGRVDAFFTGNSRKVFSGHVIINTKALTGKVSGKDTSIRELVFDSELRGGRHGYTTNGSMKLVNGIMDGKPYSVSLDFSLENGLLGIRNANLSLDRHRVRIATAALRLPVASKITAASGIPLVGNMAGIDANSGNVVITGLSGKIDCRYFSAKQDQRLEGNADLDVRSISFPDHPIASLQGRFNFRGDRADAEVRGKSLDGVLDAKIHAELFSQSRKASYTVRLRNQQLKQLSGLIPSKSAVAISGGTAEVSMSGSYTRNTGVSGLLSASGRDISLTGAGGKTLITGAGISLESELSGPDISIRKLILTQKQGLTLNANGRIARFTSNERKGNIAFSMAKTPINTLIEAFVNTLPRKLQEATCEGTCSLNGGLGFNGRDLQVNGDAVFDKASMEIASQKIQVTDIGGRIPFSLGFPWKGNARKPAQLSYSRENYQKLRGSLQKNAGTGSRFHIGKARFGALEIGDLAFYITTDSQTMEIPYIEATLYGGNLRGNGFFRYNKSPVYGADLLLNDLSLKQFCDSFPSVKGYITGKLDGVISIVTVNPKEGGVAGFANLWARNDRGEKMLVSKEFLQKLAGKNLRGFLFHNDRPYDNGEISAYLKNGYLTFDRLDISHTNFVGMRDLSVTVVPVQNRISFTHLLESIREAAARGKGANQDQTPVQTDLKWLE